MNLECLKIKFCLNNGVSEPQQYNDYIQINLSKFKEYLLNTFVDIALGNIGVARTTFMSRRLLSTVLLSLKIDIEVALDEIIYTQIKTSQGIENTPRNEGIRWRGSEGFNHFKKDYIGGIKSVLPDLQNIPDQKIVPYQALNSKNIEGLFKLLKKAPYQLLDKQINIFCNGGDQ